ncbi:MAG TPA: hypothetical protein VJ810_34155 [Blastocatellia bacterium]|nr:hypothetical protein [Blastocatellia bacterium]
MRAGVNNILDVIRKTCSRVEQYRSALIKLPNVATQLYPAFIRQPVVQDVDRAEEAAELLGDQRAGLEAGDVPPDADEAPEDESLPAETVIDAGRQLRPAPETDCKISGDVE